MSTEEFLPIDVHKITDKGHIALRLNQVQRAIIEDPDHYDKVDDDRSLNHVRKEVKMLQKGLLLYSKAQVRFEYQVLKRSADLLASWESERLLEDLLRLDMHQREVLSEKYEKATHYKDWLALGPEITEERERLFNKYRDYFRDQQLDLEKKKEKTQKDMQTALPKMEEVRVKMEPLVKVQQEINYYTEQANNWLTLAMGALVASPLLGFWWNGFWGFVLGMIVGGLSFSNITALFAYVDGKPMEELYAFLSEKYEVKYIKPFFSFDNEEEPEKPTRYDASRGDVLSKFMHKDVHEAQRTFAIMERQREEHQQYLLFLAGRKQWCQEQINRIEAIDATRFNRPPTAEEKAQLEELKKAKPKARKKEGLDIMPEASEEVKAKVSKPVDPDKVIKRPASGKHKVRPSGFEPQASDITPERAS